MYDLCYAPPPHCMLPPSYVSMGWDPSPGHCSNWYTYKKKVGVVCTKQEGGLGFFFSPRVGGLSTRGGGGSQFGVVDS